MLPQGQPQDSPPEILQGIIKSLLDNKEDKNNDQGKIIINAESLHEKSTTSNEESKELVEEIKTYEGDKVGQGSQGDKVGQGAQEKGRAIIANEQEISIEIMRRQELNEINDMIEEIKHVPNCALRTTLRLIIAYQSMFLAQKTSTENNIEINKEVEQLKAQVENLNIEIVKELEQLDLQIQKQEIISEEIKGYLQEIHRCIISENYRKISHNLTYILKSIRPLNIREIVKFLAKAEEAGKLIGDKKIILLIGETGTGKSTTVLFLGGCKMHKIKYEIENGKFLKHVGPVGPITNKSLIGIVTSPLTKSETKYIKPVFIDLSEVIGPQENSMIILCDAPGYGDTSGPEVEIANGVGVTEALKNCKSVKLLALSSFKSLGDRAQGIRKLAYMLVNMVNGIEKRLKSITYAFTKYPKDENINALLTSINTEVKKDPNLNKDKAFMKVFKDMLDKTREKTLKIDPINGNRKEVYDKLKSTKGIKFPGEVFQFPLNEKTQAIVQNQIQKDISNIRNSLKYQDNELILYSLNNIKTLKDILKKSFVRDAYNSATKLICENLANYRTEIITKFNRALNSQDGLRDEDIDDYKVAIDHIEKAQVFQSYIEEELSSSAFLKENIRQELKRIKSSLKDQQLSSPSIKVYLDNILLISNSLPEFKAQYESDLKDFSDLIESFIPKMVDFIKSNDINSFSEDAIKLYNCLPNFKAHLMVKVKVEETYKQAIRTLLIQLKSFSKEAASILPRGRLSEEDVNSLKDHMDVLRVAKENRVLQDHVSQYLEMIDERDNKGDDVTFTEENIRQIYDSYIHQIIEYFEEIIERITRNFDVDDGGSGLLVIESFVKELNLIRKIPEIEVKTALKYFRTMENINGYTQRLKKFTEDIICKLKTHADYSMLTAKLIMLKRNAEWINHSLPGTYDALMSSIKGELERIALNSKDRLSRIDYSIRFPDNISKAHDIIKKQDLMTPIVDIIPELKPYQNDTIELFYRKIEDIFKRIEKSLNLFEFNESIDAKIANDALKYINTCDSIDGSMRLRQIAADTGDKLRSYLVEYGKILDNKIYVSYNGIINCAADKSPFDYSRELEIGLKELMHLKQYPDIFIVITGGGLEIKWDQEFSDYFSTLSYNLALKKISCEYGDVKNLLGIAQALGVLDRFIKGKSFIELYCNLKTQLHSDVKAIYKRVLDFISSEDFEHAHLELSVINEHPLSMKDIDQIKLDLQAVLSKLIKDTRGSARWLVGKVERGENKDQIDGIKTNMGKIITALTKNALVELLDEKLKSELNKFETTISDILIKAILKGFDSIDTFMDGDNFTELEQGIENLESVKDELSGYYTENVDQEYEKIKAKLTRIIDEIMTRYDLSDLPSYPFNPPRDILAKIKQAASRGNGNFHQAHRRMVEKIKTTISQAIADMNNLSMEESYQPMRIVKHAIRSLPDDLQNQFSSKIEVASKLLSNQQDKFKEELSNIINRKNSEDHDIKKIERFAKECINKRMNENLNKLFEEILRRFYTYWEQIKSYLDVQNMSEALDICKKIFKYTVVLSQYNQETQEIYKNICKDFVNSLSNYSDTVASIESIDKTDYVEGAVANIIICFNFSNTFGGVKQEIFSEEIIEKAKKSLLKLQTYLYQNSQRYSTAMAEFNILGLHKSLVISCKLQNLLETIYAQFNKYPQVQIYMQDIKSVVKYSDMIDQIEAELNKIKNKINNLEIVTDDTKLFERNREDFFKNLMISLSKVIDSNLKIKDFLKAKLDISALEEECIQVLKSKAEEIGNNLNAIASLEDIQIVQCNNFRAYYQHLKDFDKYVHLPGFNNKRILLQSEEKINSKVLNLTKEIEVSGDNAETVSQKFIRIKFFAENLTMFDKKINREIDKALQNFKMKQGSAGISKLCMKLEKFDIGNRLIAEHSIFAGENWRRRREKMQNQDNLEYVLKKLDGDELDSDVLRSRCTLFKKTYDELLTTYLFNAKEDEIKTDAIVMRIKMIIGEVKQDNPRKITWDETLRDSIPEILAHIFAV